jgi:hypothetical protein
MLVEAHLTEQETELAGGLEISGGARSHSNILAEVPGGAVRINSIGCVTRDRVDCLKRCLSSYIANNKQYGRTNDIVVLDDSSSKENRNAHRQMLKGLIEQFGARVLYAGLEEKVRFAKKIIDMRVMPSSVPKFALFDAEETGLVTIGANLNALLLHTVGDAILSVDDDTVCQIGVAPSATDGARLAPERRFSSSHPCEIYTFTSRAALLEAMLPAELDILSVHEKVLGKQVRFAQGEGNESVDAEISRGHSGAVGQVGKVAVTLNGLMGDCGWGSPFYYLMLTDDSLERMIENETAYRMACTSREMLRAAPQTVLTNRTENMMATFLGLDNRKLLPPFLPITRGADYIFGLTLSQCFRDAYVAHLPWALLHSPMETRQFWPGEIIRGASGIDFDALVSVLIKKFQPEDGLGENGRQLRALGNYLMELGSLPQPDYADYVYKGVSDEAEMLIASLEDRAQSRSFSPSNWAADVARCVSLLRQSFSRREVIVHLDLLNGLRGKEAARLSQRVIQAFGHLLYWWPEMVDAARQLKLQQETLARPL